MDRPDEPDASELTFTDDDARDIRNEVINLGGLSSQNVVTLIDDDATKASIDAAFDSLDTEQGRDTLVLFSLSGHGGQVPDAVSVDEADGYDEFIAPYNTTLTGDNIIRDDELDEWLSRLKSEHVVVVLDSCNSGGTIDSSESE